MGHPRCAAERQSDSYRSHAQLGERQKVGGLPVSVGWADG